MSTASKARRLAERVEDEQMEIEHLYALLKTTVCPDEHTTAAQYKVNAMHKLRMAMDALEGADTLLMKINLEVHK